MDKALNTKLDGSNMTASAQSGTLTEGHGTMDGQIMTTVGQCEIAPIVEVMVMAETAEEGATTVVEVDPLASTTAFLSADEVAMSPGYGTPERTGSYVTPHKDFLTPVESSPSVCTPVRNMFASAGVDANTGALIKGRRVAGRRLAVVEDDEECFSSISDTSDGWDSSMTSSSQVKGKGVKRGRETLKDKVCRKGKKVEGSTEEDKKKGKGRKKEVRRKETSEEVESGDEIYGVSRGVVELPLEDMSPHMLGGLMLEWANKIEEIRGKSTNLQGRLSGDLKKYVAKIKRGTCLLMTRLLGIEDLDNLRMRNSELVDRLSEADKENARLQEQLGKEREKESPSLPSPPRKRRVVKVVSSNATQVDFDDFPPLPQRLPRGGGLQDVEKKKVGPRILSDVQIAPPSKEPRNEEVATAPSFKERRNEAVSTPAVSGSEVEWRVVASSKGRRRGRVEDDRSSPPPPPSYPLTPGEGRLPPPSVRQQQPRVRLPRPPVTSAVTITGRAEGFSYAEAMRNARERINLENLGITTSRVKKALNGGVLIEVSGKDSKLKAEELVVQLRDVFKESAVVACPTKKRELIVAGFDESVTVGDILEALCDIGGCSREDIRMGHIRITNRGLGRVWVQLPVAAATKVAEKERIRLGWTIARVELLKVRPLQCFKCWSFGHAQNVCHSVVNRWGACFRCGQKGHTVRECKNLVHCVVCNDAGLEASHRLGGPQCAEQVRPRE